MGSLPGYVHAYKALAFACLVASSVAIYLLARQFKIAEMESFLIAAISCAYPFYSSWHELIDIGYHLAYAGFLVGLAVYFHDPAHTGFPSPRRLVALALLALAMVLMNSLFVWIYGVLFCAFLATAERYRVRDAWAFFKRHPLIHILPPLEFLALRLAFPRAGQAAHYNEIQVDPGQIGKMLVVAPKRIVVDQVVDFFAFVRHDPAFFSMLVIYAVVALAGVGWAMRRAETQRPTARKLADILLGSAVLFVTGVFPYAVVGKFPQVDNYCDRHAILTLVPVAVGIVIVLRFVIRSDRGFRIAGMIVLTSCCVLQLRNYVLWQNRYIKYLAVIENLKGQEDRLQSVIVFDDHADFGKREQLRAYEANRMLKQAFHDERHIGFDATLLNKAMFDHAQHELDRVLNMFSDAKFGSEATLVDIERGGPLSESRIFFGYYLACDERAAFVKPLVKLRFTDTPVETWLAK